MPPAGSTATAMAVARGRSRDVTMRSPAPIRTASELRRPCRNRRHPPAGGLNGDAAVDRDRARVVRAESVPVATGRIRRMRRRARREIPSGSDCAQGGGTGWPSDSGNTRPGAARLEPGGDGLPVGRTAGQVEAPQTAPAPAKSHAGGRSFFGGAVAAGARADRSRFARRPAPGSIAAASAGRSSKTSAAGSRAGGCTPAASREIEPRSWSDGR